MGTKYESGLHISLDSTLEIVYSEIQMAVGPNDYYGELIPNYDEADWPDELPELDEEWVRDWIAITLPDKPVQRLNPKAA